MLNDAIAKLKTEMEQNNTNSYIQVVGGLTTASRSKSGLCRADPRPG